MINGMQSYLANKNRKVGFGALVKPVNTKPEWSLSGTDGKLRPDLVLGNDTPQAATQSQDVLSRLVNQATSQGPSQQAQYLQQANTRSMQNNLGNADALARSSVSNMTGQMAMRGGIDAGARERLGRSAGIEAMMNKQKIMNDASGANMDLLAKDEAQKTQMLQALPASLLAQAGFSQGNKRFDIENTLNTVGGKYNADMSAWAAAQSASEQAKAAKKNSGLLGLGIGGIL